MALLKEETGAKPVSFADLEKSVWNAINGNPDANLLRGYSYLLEYYSQVAEELARRAKAG